MISKLIPKQRAVSELDIESKEKKTELVFRLIEARLSVNVARIGPMMPYVQVEFGKETWKSKTCNTNGMNPKWNCKHYFEITNHCLDIAVYDKVFLFGDTEIGRCKVYLSDVLQGHLTEWWDIVSPKGENAGAVLISFEFSVETETNCTHSSNSSWDFWYMDSSPKIVRSKKIRSVQLSTKTPECKVNYIQTEPDDASKLYEIKYNLIEESERIKSQEDKVRMVFEKLKVENNKIKNERAEVNKRADSLQVKEGNILYQRQQFELEKIEIEQGREEIEKLKQSLNLSYSKLKQEKLKIRTHKKLLEKNYKKLVDTLKQLERQKGLVQRCLNEKYRSVDLY